MSFLHPSACSTPPARQHFASLDNGGQVLRLEGGNLPLYAAMMIADGKEYIGLGFTPDAAERALRSPR